MADSYPADRDAISCRAGSRTAWIPMEVAPIYSHCRHSDVLRGEAANEGLRGVLRALNHDGGSKQAVRAAAGLVDGSNPDNRLFSLLPKAGPSTRFLTGLRLGHRSKELRLALEMAANEDAERVWLAGELLDLERAWREAEEIAQIADSLGLPSSVDDQVEQLKRARPKDG